MNQESISHCGTSNWVKTICCLGFWQGKVLSLVFWSAGCQITEKRQDLGYETSTEAMAPDFSSISVSLTQDGNQPPSPPPTPGPLSGPLHLKYPEFATVARQSWSVACGCKRQLVCLFFGFFLSPILFSHNRDRFLARESYNLNPRH